MPPEIPQCPYRAWPLLPQGPSKNAVDLSGSVAAGGYLSVPLTLEVDENGDVDLFLIQGNSVIDAVRP